MRFILVYFFTGLFCASLWGGDDPFNIVNEHKTESVCLTDGLPSGIINGTVCVISGGYRDEVVDLEIPGPEPLTYSRNYSSLAHLGKMGMGWSDNHCDRLYTYKVDELDEGYEFCINLKRANGALHTFRRKSKNGHLSPEMIFAIDFPKGMTNCSEVMGGRNNIKNYDLRYFPYQKTVTLKDGEGSLTTFSEVDDSKGKIFRTKSIQKVNGHSILYDSKGTKEHVNNHLKLVNTLSGKKLSSIVFQSKGKLHKDHTITASADDGRQVRYRIFKAKVKNRLMDGTNEYYKRTYLASVHKTFGPYERYLYEKSSDKNFLRITQRLRPDKRCLSTSYYKKGSNVTHFMNNPALRDSTRDLRVQGTRGLIESVHYPMRDVHLKKDAPEIDRVFTQRAPVGEDTSLKTIYSFFYHLDENEKSGNTSVYDALYHKTNYRYNKYQQLEEITKYTGIADDVQPHSREMFIWGKNKTEQEGNLLAKALYGRAGKAYATYNYKYDNFGNLIRKRLSGALTGSDEKILTIDHYLKPTNNPETEEVNYTYSDNGLHLLLTMTESNGVVTRFVYKEGTDQLRAKYLIYDHKIQVREFYQENEDDFRIYKIVDNGSGEDKNDLTGVTERRISYYTPQEEGHLLPGSIEEKYLDLSTHQEVLLSKTQLTYYPNGNVKQKDTYDANGAFRYSEAFEYNAHGKITKETNPIGQIIERKYDLNDNLRWQKGPSTEYEIENSYDYSNRLCKQTEIHSDKTEFATTHKYNYLSQRISTTDTNGHDTLYEYNEFGQIIKTTYPAVENEKGVLVTPIILTDYDIAGFPISYTDANGETKLFENNIRGKPTRIIYPDGTQETFFYQVDGHLKEKMGREGVKTVYALDGQHRITSEEVYGRDQQLIKSIKREYNGLRLLSETDSEGLKIEYQYDGAGRLIKTFKKGVLIQEMKYDPLGNIGEVRDYYGNNPDEYRATIKSYDFLKRILEERVESADGKILELESFEYDELGNKKLIRSGDQITLTTYNSDSQPIRIQDGENHVTNIVYNTQFINEHKQIVLQTITTDPLGNQTIDTYDAANHLVKTERKNALNQLLASQKISYDLCGNRLKVSDDLIYQGKVEKSIVTLYTYTADHQVNSMTEATGTPHQKTTQYTYNKYGQKETKVKPDGVRIIFGYDSLGRLKTIMASDGTLHYDYEYNQRDQVTQVVDKISQTMTVKKYNTFGQLVEETLGNGLCLQQTCDLFDRPTSLTLPDKTSLEYVYDGSHLKEIHRIQNGERKYSHLNSEYNSHGMLTCAMHPGSSNVVQYRYDNLNRCISIDSKAYSQVIPKDGFDGVGNILAYQCGNKMNRYSYDDLNQLRQEEGDIKHEYAYDSLENRRLKDGVKHEYNELNQLLIRGKEVCTYDLNGNLKTKSDGVDSVVYRYDALDRLISYTKNAHSISYEYDAFHRLLSRREAGKPDRHFIYQGQEEIGSWESGQLKQLKILGHSPRHSVAIELDQKTYIPSQDLFGNIVNLHDLEGNLIENYRYSAFGEVEIYDGEGKAKVQSCVENPWQYCNKRADEMTGLVAFGLRFYDPVVGRWLSPDPAGYVDGSNLYAYVHNNTLKYYDLIGLFTEQRQKGGGLEKFLSIFNFVDNYGTKFVKNMSNLFSGRPTDFTNIRSRSSSLNDVVRSTQGEDYVYPQKEGFCTLFINGILNSFSDHKESLMHIGSTSGHNVQGIYSASFGALSDSFCYLTALWFGICYEPSRLLIKEMDTFFQNNPEDAILHLICHSRGAVYARNALRNYPEELRNRIVVTAIAPGAYIDKHLCRDVQHFVSNDFVPWIDIAGRFRCQDTTVRLKPHASASKYVDHAFTSKTYTPFVRQRNLHYLRGGFK